MPVKVLSKVVVRPKRGKDAVYQLAGTDVSDMLNGKEEEKDKGYQVVRPSCRRLSG